jgi:hypothetical protein
MGCNLRELKKLSFLEEEQPALYHLTNMEVNEVSLVDRAANGKTFAVVKADSSIQSTPEGELVINTVSEKSTEVKEEVTMKKFFDILRQRIEGSTELKKALTVSESARFMLKQHIGDLEHRLDQLYWLMCDVSGTWENGTLDQIVANELSSMAGDLIKIANVFGANMSVQKNENNVGEETKTEPTVAQPTVKPEDVTAISERMDVMEKSMELLFDSLEVLNVQDKFEKMNVSVDEVRNLVTNLSNEVGKLSKQTDVLSKQVHETDIAKNMGVKRNTIISNALPTESSGSEDRSSTIEKTSNLTFGHDPQ